MSDTTFTDALAQLKKNRSSIAGKNYDEYTSRLRTILLELTPAERNFAFADGSRTLRQGNTQLVAAEQLKAICGRV